MDYEDQEEEQEGEVAYNNDSLLPKIPSPVHSAAAAPPPPLRKPRYKECLKNHAVALCANAVETAAASSSLRGTTAHSSPSSAPPAAATATSTAGRLKQLRWFWFWVWEPAAAASGGGPSAPAQPLWSSREELEGYFSGPGSGGRKRFRTKFTAEQKERMLSLAERLDWKIQKQDEELVQQFCSEAGIKRHVLKVWMHNNKHTLEKPEAFCTAFIACVVGRISNSGKTLSHSTSRSTFQLSPTLFFAVSVPFLNPSPLPFLNPSLLWILTMVDTRRSKLNDERLLRSRTSSGPVPRMFAAFGEKSVVGEGLLESSIAVLVICVEGVKCDKAKAASSSADLLGVASEYGKLNSTQLFSVVIVDPID
ncbi:hypothetical protein SASPL_157769 [Salvia splendens]|uniref:Uncharacterized protein n=1 Tax=Salvia splendens TaxID=180675 RepID=A0A8X8YUE9_SALSN|nr:hypothetical protein SASPL_157769 [Salvia splendens]